MNQVDNITWMWHAACHTYIVCLVNISPFVQNRFQFQCFEVPAHWFPHGPLKSSTTEYMCKHALERPVLFQCTVCVISKQWRSSKQQLEPLSAECHRSWIQYTSNRPVNRLFIQRANVITHVLHKRIVRFRSFVIFYRLNFSFWIENFVHYMTAAVSK